MSSPKESSRSSGGRSLNKPSVDERTRQSIESLKKEIATIEQQLAATQGAGDLETARRRTEYIEVLHDYNERKDVGQMLLGRLAALENCLTKDLYPRYGLDLLD